MNPVDQTSNSIYSPVTITTGDDMANIYLDANASPLEKAKPMVTVGIIEYVENPVVKKTILNKSSGTVSVMCVNSGEGLTEQIAAFDTFAQVIDGEVELFVAEKGHLLKTGASIIIPAHTAYHIKPEGQFKMIFTVIKSAYE